MANYFTIGFGVTPPQPSVENGDVDESTYNIGEHAPLVFEIIEDEDNFEYLIGSFPSGKVAMFDDNYDVGQFIADACLNNEMFSKINNIDKDVILCFYNTLINEDLEEEDEDYVKEKLDCSIDLNEGYLEADKKYKNSLFAYIVKDTLSSDIKFEDNKVVIDNDKFEIRDIGDHDCRNYDDRTYVAISDKPLKKLIK